jgi:hypothetical protein
VEQLVNAPNQIEEDELWSQFEDNSPYYMIDEDDSSSSHYNKVQANITLKSERIIDNEMEEMKNEHFEPPKNPNPYPIPLEIEYELNAHFHHHLEEPIENVRVKLHIFHATQSPQSEKERFFLYILQAFVEASFPGILSSVIVTLQINCLITFLFNND